MTSAVPPTRFRDLSPVIALAVLVATVVPILLLVPVALHYQVQEGLRPIEVTPGMAFDPRLHEALVNVPGSEFPEGSVVAELQRGYRVRDRILRPARVAIAAGTDGGEPASRIN